MITRRSICRSISMSLISVGSLIVVLSIGWLIWSFSVLHGSIRADGRVVQLIEKTRGDEVYYPVFVFRDSSGVERTITSSVGSNPPRFPVGCSVSVLYRAQNPDDGQINDRFVLWIAPLIMIALSLFFGAIGIFIGRRPQKRDSGNPV